MESYRETDIRCCCRNRFFTRTEHHSQVTSPIFKNLSDLDLSDLIELHALDVMEFCRDIKTTNVLVDQEWRGKLCDFSFACHEECFSKQDFIYGTDEFMSPEISLALDFDKSADIFSFGIILCEAITWREPSGHFLHRRAQNMFALDEMELADVVMPGCPEELEALACLCCDVETYKRPTIQTCIEELESLLHLLGGGDFEFAPEKPSGGPHGMLVKDESIFSLSTLNLSPSRCGIHHSICICPTNCLTVILSAYS